MVVENKGNLLRVSIDKAYQNTVRFASGIELFQDTWLNHGEKTTLWGVVVHVPDYKNFYDEHITEELKLGDRICFRYDVVADGDILNGVRTHDNLIFIDGDAQWFVRYSQVFMIERGGKKILLDDYVLCESVTMEKPKSSLIITPEQYTGEVKPHLLKIVAINDNEKDIANGDTVLVDPKVIQHYNFSGIYGQDNAIVRHRHIMAKLKTA